VEIVCDTLPILAGMTENGWTASSMIQTSSPSKKQLKPSRILKDPSLRRIDLMIAVFCDEYDQLAKPLLLAFQQNNFVQWIPFHSAKFQLAWNTKVYMIVGNSLKTCWGTTDITIHHLRCVNRGYNNGKIQSNLIQCYPDDFIQLTRPCSRTDCFSDDIHDIASIVIHDSVEIRWFRAQNPDVIRISARVSCATHTEWPSAGCTTADSSTRRPTNVFAPVVLSWATVSTDRLDCGWSVYVWIV
jgi:hypothetical protein